MGDSILRIPRDARVRAYRTRDTYDGVVPATSKSQPSFHSSIIKLSGLDPAAIILIIDRMRSAIQVFPCTAHACYVTFVLKIITTQNLNPNH